MDAELGERPVPFLGEPGTEHDLVIRRDIEPAIGLHLGIALPRAPAGIAERQQAVPRPRTAADRPEDVERRGQGQRLADDQRAVLDIIRRMQHEPAPSRLDRATKMDARPACEASGLDPELLHQLGQGELVDQLVNHQPHGALLVMRAHHDDGAREARVLHLRHGDEKLSGQRGHGHLSMVSLDIRRQLPAYKPSQAMAQALRIIAVCAAALVAFAAAAKAEPAASPWFTTEQGEVRLIAAQGFVGEDAAIELGLEFRLKPHWKIYWRSPGDAGYPPRLDWSGSKNLAAAELAWPAPQRFSVLGLETVGYEGNVVLPIHARVAHTGEPLEARAALDYLTCSDICIPYQTTLALTLPAAAPPQEMPGFGPLIARYAAQVPGDGRSSGLALAGAMLHPGTPGQLDITVRSDRPLGRADAFVEGADRVAFGAPVLRQGPGGDETLLRLTVSGPPAEVAALAGRRLTITLVDGARAMTGTVTPELGAPALDLAALWPMLAIALLGGLILNAMPCVLPVLSLKLLGAIEHHSGARSVRVGFLATAVGILLSFLALAFATIGLAGAGVAVGWGMQFQSPLFLAAMIALVTLFAANLWGFYEVPLPRAAADLAGR